MPDGFSPPASGGIVNLPNLISFARLCAVPVAIWLALRGQMQLVFWLFVLAGLSDALDGWLARRRGGSALGAVLDPLADKALLVSIYVTLAIVGAVPTALAILVVSRDLMILAAVMVSWLLDNPVAIRPVLVSKVNTTAQIAFAALVLGARAYGLSPVPGQDVAVWLVAASTLASGGVYISQWLAHMTR